LSCGYYNPHTDQEYIIIDDVYDTCSMCHHIFNATKHKRYEIKRTKPISPWYNSLYKSPSINRYNPYYDQEIDYNSTSLYTHEIDNGEYFCYNCGGFAEFDDMEGAIHCKTCNSVAYPENILI